jgi:hypothetical protein
VLAHVDHLDDVRVGQLDQGADFPGEALDERRVQQQGGAGHLDDHVAAEVAVVRLVDEGHAAFAQPGGHLVATAGQRESHPALGLERHGVVRA